MALAIPWRWQGLLIVGSLAAPFTLWADGASNSTIDSRSLLIFFTVFVGSVVVGAAGFGSAAVAGAIMLFWFVPISAVPILNSASLTTQLISMGQLWKSLRWQGCLQLIIGGLIGMPFGVLLLQRANPDVFQFAFGFFLVCWSCYLLIRPQLKLRRGGPLADAIVGWTGGVTAGAIAFPGALPAIWCALTRNSKEEQRGTMQMFILVTQVCTLAFLLAKGLVGRDFISDYIKMLPAIVIGTFVGVHLFTKISGSLFRRLVLVLLLIAGATHSIHAVVKFVAEHPVSRGADSSKAFLRRSGEKKSPFLFRGMLSPAVRDGQALGFVRTYPSGIFSLSSATDESKWVLVRGIGAIEIANDLRSIESIATATTLNRTRGTGASLVDPPA